MFSNENKITYITSPRYANDDISLSLSAKGLYILLHSFGRKKFDIDDIIALTSDNEQTVRQSLNELWKHGYIVKNKDDFKTLVVPKQRESAKPKDDISENVSNRKPEKKNLFTQMIDMVKLYTTDIDLQQALIDYFTIRLHPPKESRYCDFEQNSIHKNQMKQMLYQLDTMKGNKVEIVRNAIANQWLKFVDTATTPFNGVKSNSYTEEEIAEIERLRRQQGDVY
jgi:hypothetical protein